MRSLACCSVGCVYVQFRPIPPDIVNFRGLRASTVCVRRWTGSVGVIFFFGDFDSPSHFLAATAAAAIKKVYVTHGARVKLVGKITDPQPQGVAKKNKKSDKAL